ncbi:MAG: HU family DNA-binding protein [Nitrospirota bacterium]
MTKNELIGKMAVSADISKVAATKALAAFLDGIKTSLKKGQRVSLIGFGTFSIAKRKARTGRNPRTGVAIKIPATKVPKFSAGKVLKTHVK